VQPLDPTSHVALLKGGGAGDTGQWGGREAVAVVTAPRYATTMAMVGGDHGEYCRESLIMHILNPVPYANDVPERSKAQYPTGDT
jgi:hypothetical protein